MYIYNPYVLPCAKFVFSYIGYDYSIAFRVDIKVQI